MDEQTGKVLNDLRWRLDDIRDMLMTRRGDGDSLYGIDEWSTPAINLQLAIGVIDAALATKKDTPHG